MRRRVLGLVANLALIVGAAIFLFPLLWMLSTALRPASDIYTTTLDLLPRSVDLRNFVQGWVRSHFQGYFRNSVMVAAATTGLSIAINSLAGFGFSQYNFRGRELLFLIVLSAVMVPEHVRMIPLALMMTHLGWVSTYQGVVLPSISQTTGVFLMRQYISTIPDELMEAAHIDGASDLRIFWTIVLPLSKPAIATNAILQFMWNWNSLLWPLIVLRRPAMYTVQIGLAFLRADVSVPWGPVMAMAFVSILPILVVFFALQRYFVQGIALTGLK